MIFCNNCIEGGNRQSKRFYLLSHGTVKCVECGKEYLIRVSSIVIVETS